MGEEEGVCMRLCKGCTRDGENGGCVCVDGLFACWCRKKDVLYDI